MGWQNRDDNGMTLCYRGTLIWIAGLKKLCWTKRFLDQNLKGECEVPRWGMWRGDNRLAGQVIDLLCVWCWYWGLPEFWFDPDWVVMSFHEMVNLEDLKIWRRNDFILEMWNFRCIWFSQKETSRAESGTQRQRASPDTLFHCLLNISNLVGPKLVSCIFSLMCFSTLSLPHRCKSHYLSSCTHWTLDYSRSLSNR